MFQNLIDIIIQVLVRSMYSMSSCLKSGSGNCYGTMVGVLYASLYCVLSLTSKYSSLRYFQGVGSPVTHVMVVPSFRVPVFDLFNDLIFVELALYRGEYVELI
jgi:hypothetical protein